MKKLLCIFMALVFASSFMLIVSADGIDGPKKVSDSSARTTPADWAKEDVEKALELGILDADKTYYYGSFITREEFCEIIDRFIDVNSRYQYSHKFEENPFSDTENISAICLYFDGIIYGKGEKTFAPNDFLTREEAATILSRLLKYHPNLNIESTKKYALFGYDDHSDISSWAESGVNKMTNLGVMEGYNQKNFAPKGIYTTEEAIVTVMRLHNCVEKSYTQFSVISFADLMNEEMPNDKNYMFSPLSIKMALAMAANGADGETKQEILDAVLINDLDKFNVFSKDLIKRYSQTDRIKLDIANSLWINESLTTQNFSNDYKNTTSEYYNAEANKVNFDNAVDTINGWVSEKTHGKIPTAIDNNNFWSALINAVYFKGSWENHFEESATKPDIFTDASGKEHEIDFMNDTGYYHYTNTANAEIVKIDFANRFEIYDDEEEFVDEKYYKDIDVSMYFILPKNSYRPDIESEIIRSNSVSTNERVSLSLPKFKIEYSEDIKDIMHSLGINDAFNNNIADFTPMFDNGSMFIDSLMHKTYIAVDEQGVEAAAVTTIHFMGTSMPTKPIEVKFDKPFYFAIRENISGEILFMGRYAYVE